MNSVSDEPGISEPYLLGFLTSVGLDVEYTRAEGNTLFFRGEDGEEIPVLDAAGGYGSLIFGHNHPEIVARARRLLDEGAPVNAQFSRNSGAQQVAALLSGIVRRETGADEPYAAIFANSGAEAIEAAVKHAELDRVLQVQALVAELAEHTDAARVAVESGEAVLPDGEHADFAALAEEVARANADVAARPPVFLTLEGSFHGKLVGSVQLTHNAAYRTPFTALANRARFVPLDRPEAVGEIIAEESATVRDLVVRDGVVTVVERPFPLVAAFLLEPIQGEGGIVPLTREFAGAVRRECDAAGIPVVIDEIQSGMGRTGAFLASSLIGLRGDYYVLAKSLGGGLAKTSALLVRGGRYRNEFELVHSSTFAKDGFSTPIALKVLEMLEADDGLAYRLARERGARLAEALEGVRADFPDVVKEVRGKGLMLGLEFHDQSESSSAVVREGALSGLLGYTLSGYLLREHRVRTFPTASAGNTLRFAPSIHLSDAEIDRLADALRAVASVLRDQDEKRLTGGGV
ncbi:aminotransferase class III-fold pyridoxal phosphate-dependent enzyme [Streptomyces sp. NPDC002122]|uniref:aspartate aminotransferase family protein n=1 Tax=Streptomyces sp. NPDC002122 TaxID=3154407 RepID=UPI00331C1A35